MSAPETVEATTPAPPSSTPAETPGEPTTTERKSAASVLVDLALERYDLGVTPDGEPFAVPRSGGNVVRSLRGGRSLRAELAKTFRRHTGAIAPAAALADALLVLEGEAAEADPEPVHLRIAEHDGATWIDLGDVAEHVVRVDGRGWEVRTESPVLFRRTIITGALPVPVAGGDLGELWGLLNVTEADRPLVLGWLVAALGWENIPHPMLALLGEQGTGKSSATKNLVHLVDPSSVAARKPPRDIDTWIVQASGSWVVGLDNMSVIPAWLSDSLCRAVTGDGDVRRQLFTDDGLTVFSFRRAMVMNGIDVGAMAPDLADRSIVVNLERITEDRRRPESELRAAWEDAWPRVFGALLTQVQVAKARVPRVQLAGSRRMADFALILGALDQEHGTDSLGAYRDQAGRMALDAVTSDPFLAALAEHIATPWQGTAADLHALVQPDGAPPRAWPRSSRAVTGLIKRNAPALRSAGWAVDDLGARNKDGVTRWALTPPERTRIPSPLSPPSPSAQVTALRVAGNGGDRRGTGGEPFPAHPRHTPPIPANRKPLTSKNGEAGKAGNEYGPSLADPCPTCGESLAGPGYTALCRPNHTTKLEVAHDVA